MKFKSIFTIFLLCCYISFLGAQNEDMVWLLGNDGGSTYGQLLGDSRWKRFWPFNFNFNFEPMQVEYKLDRKANIRGTLSSISDNNGQLFIFSHGRSIFGHDEKTIINGDTIGYDDYWEALNFTTSNLGIRGFQGMLMLPYPNCPDSIFYLSQKQDAVKDVQTGVYWGIVTGYKGEAPAKVVSKDNIIDHGFLGSGMMKACRYGNGRDWWIILISGDNTTYFVYLLDPTGISLKHTQRLGVRQSGFNAGNATFSYDGSRYAVIDGRYIT